MSPDGGTGTKISLSKKPVLSIASPQQQNEAEVKTAIDEDQENSEDQVGDKSPDETWGNSLEFILTALGLAVGLGNIWKFPYLVHKHGGMVFLIPYITCGILFGLPMIYLEFTLGQYQRVSPPITFRRIAPILQGVGWAGCIVSSVIAIYYIVIIGWIGVYLGSIIALQSKHWVECGNDWNSPMLSANDVLNKVHGSRCITLDIVNRVRQEIEAMNVNSTSIGGNVSTTLDYCKYIHSSDSELILRSAPKEYFYNYVLDVSDGITNIGMVNWKPFLGMAISWVITFFMIFKGQKVMGKMAYVTVIMPYLIVLIILVRGVTLEGASDGLKELTSVPSFKELLNYEAWGDALKQLCFSLGIGMSSLNSLASHNRPNNNIFRDAFIIAIGDTMMSIFGSVAIYSVLGFLAKKMSCSVKEVVSEGLDLAFVVYPEAIYQMPLPWLFAFLFFLMLFLLGISSQIALLELALNCILGQKKSWKKRAWLVSLILCVVEVSFGIILTTKGGFYWFMIWDDYNGGISQCLVSILEVLVVGWYYGASNFLGDMAVIRGEPRSWFTRWFGSLSPYWSINWRFISPLLSIAVFALTCKKSYPRQFEKYVFPMWPEMIGWMMSFSPIWTILFVAVLNVLYFRRNGYDLAGMFILQKTHRSYARIRANEELTGWKKRADEQLSADDGVGTEPSKIEIQRSTKQEIERGDMTDAENSRRGVEMQNNEGEKSKPPSQNKEINQHAFPV